MKKILVPTDFSESSLNALKYAYNLARINDSEIILFHAFQQLTFNPEYYVFISPDSIETTRKQYENELKKIAEKFINEQQSNPKETIVPIRCICEEGVPPIEINKAAIKNDVDIIVMGQTGEAKLLKKIFGSVAIEVIDTTATPVLTIPDDTIFQGIQSIVFASNYHDSDFRLIQHLANFAKPLNASIKIIHIAGPEFSIEYEEVLSKWFEKLEKQVTDYKLISFELIRDSNVLEGLHKALDNLPCDLLVMAALRRNFISRVLHKSISKSMIIEAKRPILTYYGYDNEQ